MQFRTFDNIADTLRDALSLRCPHCDVFSAMALQDVPSWQGLATQKPARMGIVATCPACRLPVFLMSGRLRYASSLIEMEGSFEPVVKPRDGFETRLLPTGLRALADEAMSCYQLGHYQALCLLAHRIVIHADETLGGSHRLDLFNSVTESAQQAQMNPALLRLCRSILFNLDDEDQVPELSDSQANALVAMIKDLLHEGFLRTEKFKNALQSAAS
ncbi:MAG: hypothetical protein AB8F65_08855 [Woeseiaceae bacterium]